MTALNESSRPRILVFTFTPIAREPRALKQIHHFARDFEVTTAGFGPAVDAAIPHIELEPSPRARGILAIPKLVPVLLVLRLHRLAYWAGARHRAARKRLDTTEWDLVIAHDVLTLPIANRLRSTHGVLADLHEYAPRQGDESLIWRLLIAPYFRWLVRREATRAVAVTTVSGGIVDEYRRRFGIESELVINATPYYDLRPRAVTPPLRLVHSGAPSPARKLEDLIKVVRETTANVTLDLYLIDDESPYLERLRQVAGGSDRIVFREPVPYSELVATLNGYDLGISVLPPINFNHLWALPNKFFDYVQARLAVVVGPSPEMARIVTENDIGAVTTDFSSAALSALIDSITPEQVETWKRHSDERARELSSEEQVAVWDRVVRGLFDRESERSA